MVVFLARHARWNTFGNPIDLFCASICKRAHMQHLLMGGGDKNVIGWTFCRFWILTNRICCRWFGLSARRGDVNMVLFKSDIQESETNFCVKFELIMKSDKTKDKCTVDVLKHFRKQLQAYIYIHTYGMRPLLLLYFLKEVGNNKIWINMSNIWVSDQCSFSV